MIALLSIGSAQALPQSIEGDWYLVHPYERTQNHHQFLSKPLQKKYSSVNTVSPTGGHYLYIASFEISKAQAYVIDFKNTSTIEFFRHQVYDQQGREVVSLEGGHRP